MMSAPRRAPLLVTTDGIEGRTCVPIGPVLAAYCLSKSLVGDMAANVKNWTTGGELRGYSDMLDKAGTAILERVERKAAEMGADAVVGMRLVTSDVAEGAAELIGYGTAVRFAGDSSESVVGKGRRDADPIP